MITGEWFSASILAFLFLSIAVDSAPISGPEQFSSPAVAMWTGILYTLAPYRLNELYQASLLSEYAACSVLRLPSLSSNVSLEGKTYTTSPAWAPLMLY